MEDYVKGASRDGTTAKRVSLWVQEAYGWRCMDGVLQCLGLPCSHEHQCRLLLLGAAAPVRGALLVLHMASVHLVTRHGRSMKYVDQEHTRAHNLMHTHLRARTYTMHTRARTIARMHTVARTCSTHTLVAQNARAMCPADAERQAWSHQQRIGAGLSTRRAAARARGGGKCGIRAADTQPGSIPCQGGTAACYRPAFV